MDEINEALRHESGDLLRGGTPVPGLVQAQGKIHQFLLKNLPDTSGILTEILENRLKNNTPFLGRYLHAPLDALAAYVRDILADESALRELVRQCDMRWGEVMGEKPYFDKPGEDPHPEDEYTAASVRRSLETLLAALPARK